MADIWNQFSEELRDLRRVKDEFRLQAHLAKAELRGAWIDLEQRWPHVEHKFKRGKKRTNEAFTELRQASRDVFEHLRDEVLRKRPRDGGPDNRPS